ncbi:MAG TPA: tail fiber domain-containing protein [Verrucomicrobiae bacterium]
MNNYASMPEAHPLKRSCKKAVTAAEHRLRQTLVLAVLASLVCAPAWAQTPRALTFQGLLKTGTGQPVDTSQSISFALYEAISGGNALYNETQVVSVTGGIFSTSIGNGNAAAFANLPFNVPYFVGIKVGADPEMTPRLPLSAAPYANFAQSVPSSSILSAHLAFDVNSLSKVSGGGMTADLFGNIGIGTANPRRKLHVGGGVAVGAVLELGADAAGKYAYSGILGYEFATAGALDIIGVGTDPSNRRIKLHASGGVAIGGPLGINVDFPLAPLHAKGNGPVLDLEGADHAYIEFYPRGTGAGRKAYLGFPGAGSHDIVIANEDGGAVRVIGTFVNNSDARYKTGIAPLENALNAVVNLRGVSYDWRKDLPDLHLSERRQIGFLAQEVEKVLPELVYADAKGFKSVAYVSLVPVLVEAMKEQQVEIETLRAKAARVDELETRLKRLEELAVGRRL